VGQPLVEAQVIEEGVPSVSTAFLDGDFTVLLTGTGFSSMEGYSPVASLTGLLADFTIVQSDSQILAHFPESVARSLAADSVHLSFAEENGLGRRNLDSHVAAEQKLEVGSAFVAGRLPRNLSDMQFMSILTNSYLTERFEVYIKSGGLIFDSALLSDLRAWINAGHSLSEDEALAARVTTYAENGGWVSDPILKTALQGLNVPVSNPGAGDSNDDNAEFACPTGSYWSMDACACFVQNHCMSLCPESYSLDPRVGCECLKDSSIAAIYQHGLDDTCTPIPVEEPEDPQVPHVDPMGPNGGFIVMPEAPPPNLLEHPLVIDRFEGYIAAGGFLSNSDLSNRVKDLLNSGGSLANDPALAQEVLDYMDNGGYMSDPTLKEAFEDILTPQTGGP
jgi:hypothetical protein